MICTLKARLSRYEQIGRLSVFWRDQRCSQFLTCFALTCIEQLRRYSASRTLLLGSASQFKWDSYRVRQPCVVQVSLALSVVRTLNFSTVACSVLYILRDPAPAKHLNHNHIVALVHSATIVRLAYFITVCTFNIEVLGRNLCISTLLSYPPLYPRSTSCRVY